MFKVFFLLFLLVPAVELFVLIQVGSEIGALTTIFLVLLTAFVGAGLMRSQGISTMQRAQKSLAMGQVPQQEMMEGVFIFMGGLLLLIPGFITDFIGLLLLIPPIRQVLANYLIKNRTAHFTNRSNVYETEWTEQSKDANVVRHVKIVQSAEQDSTFKKEESDVIDGEWQDSDTPKK